MGFLSRLGHFLGRVHGRIRKRIFFGGNPDNAPAGAIVLFPRLDHVFFCGLTGIVAIQKASPDDADDIGSLMDEIEAGLGGIENQGFDSFPGNGEGFDDFYLGGADGIEAVADAARRLKNERPFFEIYRTPAILEKISALHGRLSDRVGREEKALSDRMGNLGSEMVRVMSRRIDSAKDIAWSLKSETANNILKAQNLAGKSARSLSMRGLSVFKAVNSVLNGIDRLEVRGRDSAGISVMFTLKASDFEALQARLKEKKRPDHFKSRVNLEVLRDMGVEVRHFRRPGGQKAVSVTFVYKTAAEIGRLGDNVAAIRRRIRDDDFLHALISANWLDKTILAHTRWASVGAITGANCHPVDHRTRVGKNGAPGGDGDAPGPGVIHVCLNGDIDNYEKLKRESEEAGRLIHPDITTDTKIIPLRIRGHLEKGLDIEEAFRMAVNDFTGSHAIAMHTDLAPGRLFLAQRGSGQSIFVGIADEHYMPASEIYGFVEETPVYVKMNDDASPDPEEGGRIFILDQNSKGGLDGIKAMRYDQTPVSLEEKHVKRTHLTSRDIDRQGFDHYFLKEISQSPASVEKTLQNRWKITSGKTRRYALNLDESEFPSKIAQSIQNGVTRRVFFMGQGTAGVAAKACAGILSAYARDPLFHVSALKASELSGFNLDRGEKGPDGMADSLVIAISQSGTTTDTNLTVDMVRERGAGAIAIVNRRDSDLTFKVDGVMHTSSGRDIEMSVASTKAFYSQIVAGALLGLKIAELKGWKDARFISEEIKNLLALPGHMESVFALKDKIESSARENAVKKAFWAVVGSGPNKASADEIRIKLSELCYKTISSDFVEDKKHIDLSAEPLIIVCASGVRENVIGDIVKDTAIFRAHKSAPIVIADEGERRFDAYAHDVFNVPRVSERLAPVTSALAGHIWGYYAALAINDCSRFFHGLRKRIQKALDERLKKGLDIVEIVLENGFKEEMAASYYEFRKKIGKDLLPAIGQSHCVLDLALLLKYLSGRLPVSDFELDFQKKGTASNMIGMLFERLGELVSLTARPIDAIKHQAKTVTVGTSRITEKLDGILFETFEENGFHVSQIINRNVLVLKNIQGIVQSVEGSILYRVDGLNLMGEPTQDTTITVLKKEGSLASLPSRVESDPALKGTKRLIVAEQNVYIGKGRKDDRNIIVAPFISTSGRAPSRIEHLLLLNVVYKERITLSEKIRCLGGKCERIKNIVQENSVAWRDDFLDLIETNELFGVSAEKIADRIVSCEDSN
ncbi:Glutamine--fructose-6-phosphate aminotransferase [Candidatus Desulfarcum epimagneticum]|uniref:Glutamine--fructose-6-phosphate aminotransferase [isomerizing] n=1 Tax=uncultured Desulfobacteraceae bacterium TaxID=218296 RepID=A0A484HHR8_9BACT|nr:Glutamine--fructose-6-phosphate aminotransferase [uncultured Desulfobacteraceae bacterium]